MIVELYSEGTNKCKHCVSPAMRVEKSLWIKLCILYPSKGKILNTKYSLLVFYNIVCLISRFIFPVSQLVAHVLNTWQSWCNINHRNFIYGFGGVKIEVKYNIQTKGKRHVSILLYFLWYPYKIIANHWLISNWSVGEGGWCCANGVTSLLVNNWK